MATPSDHKTWRSRLNEIGAQTQMGGIYHHIPRVPIESPQTIPFTGHVGIPPGQRDLPLPDGPITLFGPFRCPFPDPDFFQFRLPILFFPYPKCSVPQTLFCVP